MYRNANTKDLIALAKILDYYEQFNDALYGISAGTTMSAGKEKKKLMDLIKCFNSKDGLGFDDYTKTFCKDWRFVINIIEENTTLKSFFKHCHELEDYYHYFKRNKEYISNIISLLERMGELCITRVYLQEDYDFVGDEDKTINTDANKVVHVTYYENIHFYPSQETKSIRYKALKSNYKIEVEEDIYKQLNNIIVVSNLVFDPKLLPNSINWKYLFNLIMENYKKQVDSQIIVLKDALQLSSATNAMKVACDNYINTFNRINKEIISVSTKEELQQKLLELKELILCISSFLNKYDQAIIANYPNITNEVLSLERKKANEKSSLRRK